MIDFGSTLGSAAHGPRESQAGHENALDPHELGINMVTLGFYVRSYEKLGPFQYPSIGLYESDFFKPGGFKHNIPNPAFENCTNRDGFWGAKLVMSFTDEQLGAVVTQAQYSNPEAEAYLLRILKERRDKTGRYWFRRINPLDRFNLNASGDLQVLTFVDLAVETELNSKEERRYRYELSLDGESLFKWKDIGNDTAILLPDPSQQSQYLRRLNKDTPGECQWEVKIQTFRESRNKWSKWVKVYLGFDKTTAEFTLLGIRRQE